MEIAAAILLKEGRHPCAANWSGRVLLESREWQVLSSALQCCPASPSKSVLLTAKGSDGQASWLLWCTPIYSLNDNSNGDCLCFVFDTSQQSSFVKANLQKTYRLTRAETRLVEQLLMGKTPAEAAEQLGVTIHTVRTYLKRLYQKLGVKSQATLVSKLLQTPPFPLRPAA